MTPSGNPRDLNFSKTEAGITKWFWVTIEGYLSYLLPKFEDLIPSSLGDNSNLKSSKKCHCNRRLLYIDTTSPFPLMLYSPLGIAQPVFSAIHSSAGAEGCRPQRRREPIEIHQPCKRSASRGWRRPQIPELRLKPG